MPSDNKPLPEPMLTQIYVDIWPRWVKKNISTSRMSNGTPTTSTLSRVQSTMGIAEVLVAQLIFAFRYFSKHCCSLNIAFIYGRCHCSLVTMTPVKYEGDSIDLSDVQYLFAKSGISIMKIRLITSNHNDLHIISFHDRLERLLSFLRGGIRHVAMVTGGN